MKSNLRMTRTACHVAAKNGINAEKIIDVFNTGDAYSSDKFPGQKIIKKDKISLIGVDKDESTFLVITMRVPRV